MYEENPAAYGTILNRKSVRDFLERPVEDEKRRKIYDAILSAPTTDNMMMYSVISVDDPGTRSRLSAQSVVKRAPMVLVFCADYHRWDKVFEGMTESGRAPQEGEYQLALIDAVIAAQNAVLAAETLGLGSVYLGDIMEHYEERAEALGCPYGVVPVLTLCIGYPTEKQLILPKPKRLGADIIFHDEKYCDAERDELLKALSKRGNYDTPEKLENWLKKFARRCVEGKGSAERTRSFKKALNIMENRGNL